MEGVDMQLRPSQTLPFYILFKPTLEERAMLISTPTQLLVLILATLLPALASSAPFPEPNLLADLFAASEAATAKINMHPEIPHVPNIFIPMTYGPKVGNNQGNNDDILPTPTGDSAPTATDLPPQPLPDNGGKVLDGYHHLLEIDYQDSEDQQLRECLDNRVPTLPPSFISEMGIVRLFAETSYRSEVGIVKGCGCMTLHEPESIQSFVGSKNHSFAFYSERGCRGTPAFQ
ncbi:MAG: hypothetical protein JOS17DRAFT_792164 [Linnemannia elongata]|nr:MAG: hypothetical protein JOS17DRAFT_792164 [Linnemannia elongata]